MARRAWTTFLCLALFLFVIVALQFVNHFVMLRNEDIQCDCDTKLSVEKRSVHEAETIKPVKRLTKLSEYVGGMLELLGNMNEMEQAELGTNFRRLYEVLQDIKETKNRVRNTRKLSERLIPTPSEKPKSSSGQEVCPEKFLGKYLNYGYPFFRKGFTTLNCSDFVPIEQLVTVVFDDVYTSRINPPAYERVLKGIHKYHPQMNVVYITKTKPGDVDMMKSNVKVVQVKDDVKQGEMWDTAMHEVTTKYVMVAQHLTEFDDDINLKRLVRILSEQPDVTFVSAAYRTRDGHWDMGCLQSMFQNWTLTLQGGYYMSFWDCVVCDFTPGPWLARTNEVRELRFDRTLDFGVFYDLFWKIKKQKKIAVSCPDVMFNIDRTKVEDEKFLPFAHKHDIKKIVEPNNQVRWYGCRHGVKHKKGGSCRKQKGLGVPPCDLENLADAVKLIMRECENAGLFCELQMGTLLGAVKFNKVLPWERDADLTFLTGNFSAIQKLGERFRAAGYSFSPHKGSLWCCVDGRQAGGEISMSADGWSIVLYGQHLMESEILASRGEAPTKIDFAGQMVTVVRNPGLFARNRYGANLYRHQEHWLDRGKQSGWHFYDPGKFEGCPNDQHSACLSQYAIDGNMQFDKNICQCTYQPPQR